MNAVMPAPPKPASTAALYRALVGVGVLCAFVIASAYQLTAPVIEAKRTAALERAIFEVLPEARTRVSFVFGADGTPVRAESLVRGDGVVHAGYAEDGRLVGFAIEGAGYGYQDVIRLLYGYTPAEHAITGMRILEMRETPGLGDRVITDPAFVANFERLDVSLAPGGEGLAHPIETDKRGEKVSPWQIDGITGATITSKAVGAILRESAQRWIPAIESHMDSFRTAGGEADG